MALVAVLLVVLSFASCSEVLAEPLLWPLPQSYSHGTAVASLPSDPKGSFFGVPPTPMLGRAFARYSKIIFLGCDTTGTGTVDSSGAHVVIPRLEFSVSDPRAVGPAEHMDEWYELKVPVSGPAVARARTQWGALRALETFSQAVESCTITGLPLAIADAPRFTHRGLLLDMARVWWSMDGVLSVIDAMQFSKLNVLHLHLTDSEAFPVETTAFNATLLAYDPKNGCRAPQPQSAVASEGGLSEDVHQKNGARTPKTLCEVLVLFRIESCRSRGSCAARVRPACAQWMGKVAAGDIGQLLGYTRAKCSSVYRPLGQR